jgi:hypothetical protein
VSTSQLLLSILGVLAGLTAGLGAPLVTSRLGRQTAVQAEQQQLAREILDLWRVSHSLQDLLRNDINGARRNLLLLGVRLRDQTARESCLQLVQAATSGFTDDQLIDAWSDMVGAVSAAYRRSASIAR